VLQVVCIPLLSSPESEVFDIRLGRHFLGLRGPCDEARESTGGICFARRDWTQSSDNGLGESGKDPVGDSLGAIRFLGQGGDIIADMSNVCALCFPP
jgi:hypothetical protein